MQQQQSQEVLSAGHIACCPYTAVTLPREGRQIAGRRLCNAKVYDGYLLTYSHKQEAIVYLVKSAFTHLDFGDFQHIILKEKFSLPDCNPRSQRAFPLIL